MDVPRHNSLEVQSLCLTGALFNRDVGRGGRVITGLLPCVSLLLLLLLLLPTPSDISRCPAEIMHPIIMLRCHVSGAVSTPLRCLAPVCHLTEGLPSAITAVKKKLSLYRWRGVSRANPPSQIKFIFLGYTVEGNVFILCLFHNRKEKSWRVFIHHFFCFF